jgi:ribosomal protein S18 acetylase RimI-like enzyme
MIRYATPKDITTISQLWYELAQYHTQLDEKMPQPVLDGKARYEMRLSSALQDPNAQVIVAEVDEKVMGYVLGMVIDLLPEMFAADRAGFLADIYVAPTYQRQGYGYALVDALRDWFQARGIKHFEWHVATSNPNAIAFWRKIGGQDVMLRMRADINE